MIKDRLKALNHHEKKNMKCLKESQQYPPDTRNAGILPEALKRK